MLRTILLIGLLVSPRFFIYNQTTAANPGLTALKSTVESTIKSAGLKNGDLGFVLMDVNAGTILHEYQADKSLLPASTMKVVTSMAALGILGEEYTFKTVLEYDGTIDAAGVLHGDLYIRGGGDPTLGSEKFAWGTDRASLMRAWAQIIRDKGIKKVEGAIVGDESVYGYDLLSTTWVWGDIGNYYGAAASGLTFNENLYYLYFKPGKSAGDSAQLLRCDPPVPGMLFRNQMKTGAAGSGDNGYIYGAPFTYRRDLRGTIPMGSEEFSIKGSLPDPPLFCAQSLRFALDSLGISSDTAETMRMRKEEKRIKPDVRTAIHTHTSPPLKDIVYWVNKKSVNLFAEHLLHACGYAKYKDASHESGAKAISEYWASKGIDVKGLQMMDGSGLSRYNGVTPRQHVNMLRLAVKEPWYKSFYASLPIAGDPNDIGSISSMCRGTDAANNLRAKSGYISRVRCYTGYVNSKSGKPLCFSMLSNNYTCSNADMKDLLEKLMVAMAGVE